MQDLQYLEINLKNLKYNINNLKGLLSKNTMLMAVVKSNAYGHGIVECAKSAVEAGANWLGVVNINEALNLRKNNIKTPILVLGYVDNIDFINAAINNISVSIFDNNQVNYLINNCDKLSKKLKIHIKLETGLNRLGFLVTKNNILDTSKIREIYNNLIKCSNIYIEGLYSHLSSVEEDLYTTHGQNDLFGNVIDDLIKHGIKIPIKHIAASAAAMLLPETHYDMVRCGIAIYGLWPSSEVKKLLYLVTTIPIF